MGDIKYRVWDRDEKCMYLVDSIHYPLGKPSGKDVTIYNWKEDCYEWIYNYDLMKSTGFKDKNDEEIYVGDILKYNRYGLVVVDIDNGWAVVKNSKFEDLLIPNKNIEVVGNVYELLNY